MKRRTLNRECFFSELQWTIEDTCLVHFVDIVELCSQQLQVHWTVHLLIKPQTVSRVLILIVGAILSNCSSFALLKCFILIPLGLSKQSFFFSASFAFHVLLQCVLKFLVPK